MQDETSLVSVHLQASMSNMLTAQLEALSSLPAHIAAPATASLLQAFHSAMGQFPADPAQQGQALLPALHSLYALLLQQSLTRLLDGAVSNFATLAVVGHAEGSQGKRPLIEGLVALLGQVSCPCTHIQTHLSGMSPA